jgi:hypothetical protein
MAEHKSSIERRFWKSATVSESGCWEWNAYKSRDGYGVFCGLMAHRVAYEFAHGPLPPFVEDPTEKNCILHECHNRACVNPDHLSLGTKRENLEQARALGRLRGGRKGGTGSGKPVTVHGVMYQNLVAASREVGLSRQQLRYALATHQPWISGPHK